MSTNIPYVDEVWNPICGCTKCSPGCENCWAEKMMYRQVVMGCARHVKDPDSNEDTWIAYSDVVDEDTHKWNGVVALRHKQLDKPLHWRKPRKILTCSMGDWCHPKVPFEFRDKMLAIAALCPQHDFWFLTKRAEGMAEYFKAILSEQVYCENVSNEGNTRTRIRHEAFKIVHKSQQQNRQRSYNMWNGRWPLLNIHLGCTICNQKEMDEKGEIHLSIPAAHHWWSFEPLLGDIDFSDYIVEYIGSETCSYGEMHRKRECECMFLHKPDFAVIGCESGPKRRPIARKHIKDLYEQCKAAGVDVMVKQMAENPDGSGKVIHDLEWIKAELGD